MVKCKSCGLPVIWRKHTESRQSMPIDEHPAPGGNLAVLDGDTYAVVPKEEAATRTDLHKSHFATCLHAQLHRKPKGKT